MNSTQKSKLSYVLDDLCITQTKLVKYLKVNGFKTSSSSFSRIKVGLIWPKLYTPSEIVKCKEVIEAYLIEAGATSAHIEDLWELCDGCADFMPDKCIIYEDPEPEMLTNNCKRFFKLKHDPFENEITSEGDVFLTDNYSLILEEILSAASAGSMSALIGECGSGKTILRRAFIARIQQDHPEVILIQPAKLDRRKTTAESISIAICRALHITANHNSEIRDADIEEALIESANNGNLHLLVIDEAHDLPVDVIKQFKRIWELTHGFKRVLGIVLIGQTELEKKLAQQNVREFTWRCNKITMLPLGIHVPAYIRHKFECAGANADDYFDEEAMLAIKDKCSGKIQQGLSFTTEDMDRSYPLHVNSWLSRTMNMAAQIGQNQITAKMIERVK